MLLVALALAMAGVYGQVTVNDIVLARYTADAWRGRVYAVRYFLVFITAGAAVATIAFLHARGGFDLVLLVTAGICLVFFLATLGLASVVSRASTQSRSRCRRNKAHAGSRDEPLSVARSRGRDRATVCSSRPILSNSRAVASLRK